MSITPVEQDGLDLTDPDAQVVSYSELSTGMVYWAHAQNNRTWKDLQ